MSNRFQDILSQWHPAKDETDWALATIVQTKGSSYRKAGAHMMINSLGQSFGMLSGGCLEADLKRQARKCWDSNQPHIVCYDMSDESDISWQLGIGCGGMVRVLIQPVTKDNNYHNLAEVYQALTNHQPVSYSLDINNPSSINALSLEPTTTVRSSSFNHHSQQFTSIISSKPQLVIFGAGIDTLPLISLAKTMAWNITLIDERSNYARPSEFKSINMMINQSYQSLTNHAAIKNADAIVIMHHNIELDAKAINLAQHSNANYLGLLGPTHRTERVFEHTNHKADQLRCPLTNPIGLDLGGDLPETIALSIVSQIQAHLAQRSAKSLNQYNNTIAEVTDAS
ncbi:XdhC family protein [Psychrobium sp. MM17-31]|uniref:XdhC family protein n=1 Tax=Psychrobium sp. MM17-31 TaxID=2917758 RepID=UPI001EF5CED9|nr:XdhC family protein [Psychrobium sp. MM17-31]MCG7531048.1 XdhC family protein [Psychrobium sp. MM17-31]